MKKLVILFPFMLSLIALFAQSDTTAVRATLENVDEAGFAPGIFFMVVLGMVALVTAFFIVAIVSGLSVAILMGLTAAGILSVSIGMGLYKRSFYAGFKWSVYLTSGVGGMTAVALISFFIKLYWPKAIAFKTMLSWGCLPAFSGDSSAPGLSCSWAGTFMNTSTPKGDCRKVNLHEIL